MNKFVFKNNRDIELTSLSIEGARVCLRSIDHDYAEHIYNEFTPTITRYMVPKAAEAIDETHDFINKSIADMRSKNGIMLVILNETTDEFLGCCGFLGADKCETPELGIWLKLAAHGLGFGHDAIHTLCKWAVDTIEFDYAIYPVDRANMASRRIPESLGGKIYREEIVETMSGGQLDEVIYKLTHQELKVQLHS